MTLHRTNWHEAAVCAIQIDLRDYAHMLEYHPEYTLSNNKNRIDLLVIRKLLDQPIPGFLNPTTFLKSRESVPASQQTPTTKPTDTQAT